MGVKVRKLENEIGKVYPTTRSGDIEILEYENYSKVLVRFKNSGRKKYVGMKEVRGGNVLDRFLPHRGGVGIVGEGKYKSKNGNRYTREFGVWKDMIDRCYVRKEKFSAYRDVDVCKEWHNFQNFAEWCVNQKSFNAVDDTGRTFTLDKDILRKGNRTYAPETCCFIPQEINTTLTLRRNHRGDSPLGVAPMYIKTTGKTRYTSSVQTGGKGSYLGSFDTPEGAFQAYKQVKENRLKFLADKWRDFITEECYSALLAWEVEIDD